MWGRHSWVCADDSHSSIVISTRGGNGAWGEASCSIHDLGCRLSAWPPSLEVFLGSSLTTQLTGQSCIPPLSEPGHFLHEGWLPCLLSCPQNHDSAWHTLGFLSVYACVSVYHMHAGDHGATRGRQSLRNWSYR